MDPQLDIFDTTVELVATDLAPTSTETDQQLIDNLQAGNADRWSAPNLDRRRGTHSLFQYPGRMVPEVQQALVQAVQETQPSIREMLDPYMGSATSLVAGLTHGLHCYGQDINPLAILIAQVKTTWIDVKEIRICVLEVLERAGEDTRSDLDVYFPGITKWFRSDVADALSKLRRAIHRENDIRFRRFLWVTLAETIRLTSNDRTSTYKLHVRPEKERNERKLDVMATFREQAIYNITDLHIFHTELDNAGHNEDNTYKVTIDLLNSTQELLTPADPLGFDLLVTSPPYGDNKTTIPYGQHAFLPLQWIDLDDIDPRVETAWLRTTNEIDRLSMGGMFHVRSAETLEKLRDSSPTLRSHLDALLAAKAPSESYRKVVAFYDDFYRSLELISQSLKPDAYLVWTLGNRRVNKMLIQNDLILREFLGSLSCEYITELERIIHSKRMAHKNSSGSTMANEQILVLRKTATS